MRPRYKPRPNDIKWAQDIIDHTTEGGSLVYPRANLHYLVFHSPVKN